MLLRHGGWDPVSVFGVVIIITVRIDPVPSLSKFLQSLARRTFNPRLYCKQIQ